MHPESSAIDKKQRSPLSFFYLPALAFVGAFHSHGVFPVAVARNTPHRNDRHRWFCLVGSASFPCGGRRRTVWNSELIAEPW